MAHQSEPSRTRNPFGDLTNTYQTGEVSLPCNPCVPDETVPHDEPQEQVNFKARRQMRDRERYAAMSREKKDENNRKRRERRMKNKADTIEVIVSMDEDEDNEWLHRGHFTGNNDVPAGGEVLSSAKAAGDCIHDNCMDNTIVEGGKYNDMLILNVSDNKLKELPESIGGCNSLEELQANGNSIEDVPSSVCNLVCLKSLSLNGNKIRQLPENILKDCTALQNLSLHDNPITMDHIQMFQDSLAM